MPELDDLDGLPCDVPYERGRQPSVFVQRALRDIGRRHRETVRAIYAPAHICQTRAKDNSLIIGAWVYVQRCRKRIPAGMTLRMPSGVEAPPGAVVEVWAFMCAAEDTATRRVFDLAGDDGPAAIAHLYRFTSWAADEDRRKQEEYDAHALAAMLADLRARGAHAANLSRSDVIGAADHIHAQTGASLTAPQVKEWERRIAEVSPRVEEAQARAAVRQDEGTMAELGRALGEFAQPLEVG